jgi:hypothetical protein
VAATSPQWKQLSIIAWRVFEVGTHSSFFIFALSAAVTKNTNNGGSAHSLVFIEQSLSRVSSCGGFFLPVFTFALG